MTVLWFPSLVAANPPLASFLVGGLVLAAGVAGAVSLSSHPVGGMEGWLYAVLLAWVPLGAGSVWQKGVEDHRVKRLLRGKAVTTGGSELFWVWVLYHVAGWLAAFLFDWTELGTATKGLLVAGLIATAILALRSDRLASAPNGALKAKGLPSSWVLWDVHRVDATAGVILLGLLLVCATTAAAIEFSWLLAIAAILLSVWFLLSVHQVSPVWASRWRHERCSIAVDTLPLNVGARHRLCLRSRRGGPLGPGRLALSHYRIEENLSPDSTATTTQRTWWGEVAVPSEATGIDLDLELPATAPATGKVPGGHWVLELISASAHGPHRSIFVLPVTAARLDPKHGSEV